MRQSEYVTCVCLCCSPAGTLSQHAHGPHVVEDACRLSLAGAVYSLAGLELLRGPFEPIAKLLGAPAGTPEAIIHWG